MNLKYISLCLGLSALLVGCGGKEQPAHTDPAMTEAPAGSHQTSACQVTPDPGPCKAQIEKFFFDPATKKCASFNYGGCEGTVPFETMQACQSACETETSAAIGCTANGMEYNVGDSWQQSCNTCTCTSTDSGPTAICTDTPCDMSTTPNDVQQAPATGVAPSSSATPAAPAAPATTAPATTAPAAAPATGA